VILTRLRRSVQRQDWFAVVLEVLIVVLGVAIGFQVTEWGNARAARAQEQELLRGLRAEFVEVAAGIEAQVQKHRRVETAVANTLAAMRRAQGAGAAYAPVADSTLVWALVSTTTQFSQGVLSGTLRTGRLDLVRDLELRTALSEWDGVLADVTEDELDARDIGIDHIDPMLWSRMDVSPFRRYALFLDDLPRAGAGTVSEVPVDIEVLGAFAVRLYWQQHVIREFEGPRSEAQRILRLIDRALE
jgi:hypothetical protein